MAEKHELPPSDREATASRQERGDPLTEAQRVIAQLIGRLLAQRWRGENRALRIPTSAERNDGSSRTE
jgi:hypothetical protein